VSITRKLAGKIMNYDDAQSIGSKLRAKRIKPLLSMIDVVHENCGRVNILDLGGRKSYWKIFPEEVFEQKNVYVTLLNMPGSDNPEAEKRFVYVEGDACDLSEYSDNSFDIVHSNSVIEHVGDWHSMVRFSNEVKRLARNYYIQTPYYWFFIEPHYMTPFFHWLPKPIRVSLVMRFALGHRPQCRTIGQAVDLVESVHLLDKKMFRALFEEAELITEKFMFLSKSLIVVNSEPDI